MIGISIQFLTGRYHATPWDKQVNEGVVEWPPSPWRIMRSLISAYYRSPKSPKKILVSQLLEKLAEEPPTYYVPIEVGSAHTQHYMPLRKSATTKIYDTFFTFPGGALSPKSRIVVSWPQLQMDDLEKELLQCLCDGVSYLGRAESWAVLSVLEKIEAIDLQEMKTITVADSDQIGNLQVLCPLSAAKAAGFCAALQAMPQVQKSSKGSKKAKNSPIQNTPQTLMDLLELNISDLYQQGWNGVPGAFWVSYAEEKTDSKERITRQNEQNRSKPKANFARYVLSCPVLPQVTKAISLGEKFRQSLMSRSKGVDEVPSPTFSGKHSPEHQQSDFAIGHEHAYYLPEVNPETGKIEQVVVFSAKGFEDKDFRALGSLSKLWGRDGLEIRTVLMSLGQVENFAPDFTDTIINQRSKSSLVRQVIGKSQCWKSLTPVVLPRHSRNRYIPDTSFLVEGLEDQVLRLLGQLPHLALPKLSMKVKIDDENPWLAALDDDGNLIVKVREIGAEITSVRSGAFQRTRYQGDGKRSSSRGYWLELEFAKAQLGPIAIGYASHFGLGVFCPE